MQVFPGAVEAGGISRDVDEDGNVTLNVPYLITEVGGSLLTRPRRVAERLPQKGARLSGEPGIQVTNVNVSAFSRELDVYTAVITYSAPTRDTTETQGNNGSVTFTADTVTEKVTEDIRGRPLKTEYYNLRTFGITRLTHEADVDKPLWTVTIRKTLNRLPKTEAQVFIATVNSRGWSGFRAKTWLCRNIQSTQRPDGKFDTDFVFSYNPNTWRLIVNTKVDGLIPADVRNGNGRKRFDVYKLQDFNRLRVRF